MHFISKCLLSLLVTVIFFTANGQTSETIYQEPLSQVLNRIETKYKVTLRYDAEMVKDLNVKFAMWRFTSTLKETLDNVLRPLDLVCQEVEKDTYIITQYCYYRRTEEEGKKHLNELLNAYPNAASFDQRKAELKSCIASALGIKNMSNRTALNPVFRPKIKMDGYTVENVAFESIPGYFVTGTLYRPVKGKGPFPVILNPHGHFYNEQDPSVSKDSGRYRADMQIRCASLAKMGAIVLSYDMYAWGESYLQTGSMSYHETGFAASMQTWNSIRALDFLLSLQGADKTRVGVTGASGGGTQTFLLAALDERVTVSVPVVMVSSAFYGGCPCESGLPIHAECNGHATNNTEIAAMIAPKPLLVISDGDDWTRSVPGTDFPYLQKIYGFYNQTQSVESVYLPNDKHDYGFSKRQPMYTFLAKHLGLQLQAISDKRGAVNEAGVTIQTNKELLVFGPDFPLPARALKSHESIMKVFQDVLGN